MKPTRQGLEKENNRYFIYIIGLCVLLAISIILWDNSDTHARSLQSQLNEIKQNGTYTIKCDAPREVKIDTTTPEYFCGKYNGIANYGLGTTYCEIVIKDVYNLCRIVRVGNSYAFDINPNYNSCNWSEVIPQ